MFRGAWSLYRALIRAWTCRVWLWTHGLCSCKAGWPLGLPRPCQHPRATRASGWAWLNLLCRAWPVGLEAKPGHDPDQASCWHDPRKIMLGRARARAMPTRPCFVPDHLSMARMANFSHHRRRRLEARLPYF
jgi:hypothetical protein